MDKKPKTEEDSITWKEIKEELIKSMLRRFFIENFFMRTMLKGPFYEKAILLTVIGVGIAPIIYLLLRGY